MTDYAWEDFSFDEHWRALCEYALMSGKQARLAVEEDDGSTTLLLRTAHPRLNPTALIPTNTPRTLPTLHPA